MFEKYAIFESFLDLYGGLKSFKKHWLSMVLAKNAFTKIAFEGSLKKSIFRSPGGAWEPKGEFQLVVWEFAGCPPPCAAANVVDPQRAGERAFFKGKPPFSLAGTVFRHTVISASHLPPHLEIELPKKKPGPDKNHIPCIAPLPSARAM